MPSLSFDSFFSGQFNERKMNAPMKSICCWVHGNEMRKKMKTHRKHDFLNIQHNNEEQQRYELNSECVWKSFDLMNIREHTNRFWCVRTIKGKCTRCVNKLSTYCYLYETETGNENKTDVSCGLYWHAIHSSCMHGTMHIAHSA